MRLRAACRRSRVRSSGPAKHFFRGDTYIIQSLPLIQGDSFQLLAKGCALSTG